ncbi:hypothetical protein ACWGQ5_54110 [Streptomyces sp. NPDC055722]
MKLTTYALIPALQDARDAHAAVIDRFRTDMPVTPVGPHRQAMEHHLADAQVYLGRIDDHVRAIRPRHLLFDTTAVVRTLIAGAVRAARVPLEVGAVIADGVLYAGRPATGHRLLRTVEGEYAVAARALAACRVGESIAALTDDERAMDLLGGLRHLDERILETLENSLEHLAQTLVMAAADDSLSLRAGGMSTQGAQLSGVRSGQLWQDNRTGSRARTGPQAVAPAPWAGSMDDVKHRMGTTG